MPSEQTEAAIDLEALAAITDAVEAGAGLPEVVRAAARALDASLVLIDRSSAVLAVAARSSADERALMTDAAGVQAHELRVGDAVVGRLRLRGRGGDPSPALLRIVTTLIASEVERLRAPERASEAAQEAFLRAVLHRQVTDRGDIVARAGRARRRRRRRRRGDRRPRAPLRARRGGLADPRARRRRARGARRRPRLDRGDRRARARDRRPGARPHARGRRSPPRAAPPRRSRASSRPRCTASRSPSATRASRSTRPTSTAPATRRCSPPTSRSAARRATARASPRRCSPSSRRAPTGCCCRR